MNDIIVNRLQPAAVRLVWSKLLFGIQQAAPITNSRSAESYTNILAALLSEEAQCFIAYTPGESPEVHGFVISIIKRDDITEDKYLFLYCIYGYRKFNDIIYNQLQEVIEAFAREQDCHILTGFTNNEYLRDQLIGRGGKTDQVFLYKEL